VMIPVNDCSWWWRDLNYRCKLIDSVFYIRSRSVATVGDDQTEIAGIEIGWSDVNRMKVSEVYLLPGVHGYHVMTPY